MPCSVKLCKYTNFTILSNADQHLEGGWWFDLLVKSKICVSCTRLLFLAQQWIKVVIMLGPSRHRGRRMQAMWWKRADTAEESQYYYSTNIIIEQAGGSLASYISTLTVWFYINRTLCRQPTLYNETDHRILVTVRRKCRCPSFIGTPIIWSGFTEHCWILYNEIEYFTEHCWRLYNETEYCRPALLYWCFYCSDCLFKPNTNKSNVIIVGIQKCTYMLNLYGRSIK